jgi:hypothetical protein
MEIRFANYRRLWIIEKIGLATGKKRSDGVPLPSILVWNDQEILLYHGTLDIHAGSILQRVDLNKCRHLKDFGRGL